MWRKVVKTDAGIDRRAYEVAVMMALRERLRSGDVWVEGSRAFRAFDDFLLPRDAFENRRKMDELGLAIPDRFEDWRDDKAKRLGTRLREVDALTAAGELPEASLTEEGLSISPIRVRRTKPSTRSPAASTRCCRVCKSPSSSRKSTAGRASPIVSCICEPARHLTMREP